MELWFSLNIAFVEKALWIFVLNDESVKNPVHFLCVGLNFKSIGKPSFIVDATHNMTDEAIEWY